MGDGEQREGLVEFVDGWDIVQTLGEGAFGEVKLVVNRDTKEAVAMKIINLVKHPNAAEDVRKEVCIHRMLNHERIVRFFGYRRDEKVEYIFLEYASGGELFDKIEPDQGMPQSKAQHYFCQLIEGVEFLHSRGITHRDLKPENLLLDDHDNLKISDFGLATVFRYKGKERELDKRCGTLPYVAPEVLVRKYQAQPADIWSCGVILVAMLTGDLPWDEPTTNCEEFMLWKDSQTITVRPWNKINTLALSLLRRILTTIPTKRYTIEQIRSHQWFQKSFRSDDSVANPAEVTPGRKRPITALGSPTPHTADGDFCFSRMALSQPEPEHDPKMADPVLEAPAMFSFSQPAHIDNMLLTSQVHTQSATSGSGHCMMQRLVKRMTRFVLLTCREKAMDRITKEVSTLGCTWKIHTPGVVTVSTQDRRKMQLVFKASIYEMQNMVLIDFRLSKGCGLEFKRRFLQIKENCVDLLYTVPVSWSLSMATNLI